MLPALRILTFDWRPRYVDRLAGLGGRWDLVPAPSPDERESWTRARTLPASVRIAPWPAAAERLRRRLYDVAVCHSFTDLERTSAFACPVAAVVHVTRDAAAIVENLQQCDALLAWARSHGVVVFTSEYARSSWSLPECVVIEPAVDPAPLEYSGHERRVLAAGDLMRETALESGYFTLVEAVAGLPSTLAGFNPRLGSRVRPTPEAMAEAFRVNRALIAAPTAPYAPPWTPAMLGAMAAGMPVVALAHPTTPIEDGVAGLVGADADGLRAGLLALLEDRDFAARIGRAGRALAIARFGPDRFDRQWTGTLEAVAAATRGRRFSQRKSVGTEEAAGRLTG
jgi:hypothetical protein